MGFDILRRGAGHRSSRAAVLTAAMLGAAIMAGALPAVGAEPDAAQRTLLVPRDALFASRSEEHTSELPSLMRISYADFCLQKKITELVLNNQHHSHNNHR